MCMYVCVCVKREHEVGQEALLFASVPFRKNRKAALKIKRKKTGVYTRESRIKKKKKTVVEC